MRTTYAKHVRTHASVHAPFGTDRFGVASEKVARFFGTPQYIIGQTIVVVLWIAINVVAVRYRWDPYPFILLNLAFSTQAAYAAPLILLAQTRQADRDKAHEEASALHREELAARQERLLEETAALMRDLHARLDGASSAPSRGEAEGTPLGVPAHRP